MSVLKSEEIASVKQILKEEFTLEVSHSDKYGWTFNFGPWKWYYPQDMPFHLLCDKLLLIYSEFCDIFVEHFSDSLADFIRSNKTKFH